jgi:hypothetical protein
MDILTDENLKSIKRQKLYSETYNEAQDRIQNEVLFLIATSVWGKIRSRVTMSIGSLIWEQVKNQFHESINHL